MISQNSPPADAASWVRTEAGPGGRIERRRKQDLIRARRADSASMDGVATQTRSTRSAGRVPAFAAHTARRVVPRREQPEFVATSMEVAVRFLATHAKRKES